MQLLKNLLAVGCMAIGLFAGSAQAQDYPTRPVELLVPFPAGGGSDVLARAFAEASRKHFPQPIIVTNKPGAIGSIGFLEGATAKPDGHKITMVSPELLLAAHLGIGKVTFEDFVFICRINLDPAALTVRADAPWNTIEEFLAHARAKPGQLTVASSGTGSIYHVASAALEEQTGIKVNHVPYQGSAPAILGLLSGQVDATTVSPGEVSAYVAAGKLKVLAIMTNKRIKGFESVPTFKERNIDLQVETWRGLAVPKTTPAHIVQRLGVLMTKVNEESAYRDTFERQHMGFVYEPGDRFRLALAKENDQFKRIVPALHITKQ